MKKKNKLKNVLTNKTSLALFLTSSLLLGGCSNKKGIKSISNKSPLMEHICIETTKNESDYCNAELCETHIYVDTETAIEYFGVRSDSNQMIYTPRLDQNGKPKINKKYLDKLINPNIKEDDKK